jgi:hypothetical protein
MDVHWGTDVFGGRVPPDFTERMRSRHTHTFRVQATVAPCGLCTDPGFPVSGPCHSAPRPGPDVVEQRRAALEKARAPIL